MNRQIFPSALFPLRGDISAEAGATSVIVQGIQGIPVVAPPIEPAGLDTFFYDSYNHDWFYASPWDIPVGIPLVWEGYGYGSSGISWIAPDTLAFGNGTEGDVSGAAAMTALVLFGSASYYGPYNDYDVDYGPSYDQFYTSIFSGATQNWNLVLPSTPGASGQVLTTNGTGVSYWSAIPTVTTFSAGTLSPLFTTSVANPTTTPALSFSLTNAGGGTIFGNNATTSGAPAYIISPVLGIPGTSTGSIALASSTASGKYTITAPANAATPTLTLPTGSGTFAVSASGALSLNATTGALTFSGAGAVTWDQIGNAAANLTLANANFTTTFNQTRNIAWLWANTTVATGLTTNASPLIELAANYWTGAASAQDLWTIGSSLAAGTNGASTLAIAHSGSTGSAIVSVPALYGFTVGSSNLACTNNAVPASGVCTHFFSVATQCLSCSVNSFIGWGSQNNASAKTMDVGLSRLSAGVLGVGNGTAGNATGNLSFNKVIQYAGVATTRGGVPAQVATVALTAQTAAITTTTLYAVPATGGGLYRISFYAKITTAASVSSVLGGTNGFQLTWTDPTDTTTPTTSIADTLGNALNGNTTTTADAGDVVIEAKASTNIQYAYDYTSAGTAMAYKMSISVEFLG